MNDDERETEEVLDEEQETPDPEDTGNENPDDSEEGDSGFSEGANRRIRELNDKYKAEKASAEDLKKRLEAAQKLSGDDGKAILSAAEASGILPQFMTIDEAKAFKRLDQIPKDIDALQMWVDDHDKDEKLDIGNGRELSFAEVRQQIRDLQREQTDLERKHGGRRETLKKDVSEILKLGLAAKKAGWDPNQKPKKNAGEPKNRELNGPQNPTQPAARGKIARDIKVTGMSSLAAKIAAQHLEKIKKGA